MTREELEMRRLVRESDVIDKTDGSELAKAFNHLWEKYIEQEPCDVFEELDFVQEHKKTPVTLDLTPCDEYGNYKYPGDIELIEPNMATSMPCDDAISRQAMHIELEKWITYGEYKYSNATKYLYERIDRLPLVNPRPKTGYWIRWYEQKEYDGYIDNIPHCKCSECGEEYDPHSSQFIKYCNECGARMSES